MTNLNFRERRTPQFQARILALQSEGLSYTKIGKRLKEEFGFSVSSSYIGNFLKERGFQPLRTRASMYDTQLSDVLAQPEYG